MFFSHVYSPRLGQTTHCRQKFYDNRKAFFLCPYVASFKMISSQSDFIHAYSPVTRAYNLLRTNFWWQQKAKTTLLIRCKFKKRNLILYTFLMLYMYISPGQEQTTPWGQTFDVNRKPLPLCPFVAGLKKECFKVWFYIHFFFMLHHIYIAPSRGRQSTVHKILMTTERPFLFAHMLQVSKWSLSNLILHTFLMMLYMYIAPGQGQKTPWGQTFDVNFYHLLQVSNKSLWILILYTFFNVFSTCI